MVISICPSNGQLFLVKKTRKILGTGHKVTARVGRSDLGSAMENLWADILALK
jgi:hypothetical protein